jgi:peptidoglycan/LPS O-acetylase OafA/YrhL
MAMPRAEADCLEKPGAFRLGYRPWLDGMRGLAILAVFVYHLQLLGGGFLGVDLFFVLSGFLITSLLLQEWQERGSISFSRFYLRRALRLLPALFALIIACGAYILVFRPDEAAAFCKEAILTACYVANCPTLHDVSMPTLGHAWSLSLEEQFYLVWPLLLYAMLRLRLSRRVMIALLVAGIVASAAWRCVLFEMCAVPHAGNMSYLMRIYAGLDTRADVLLVGCLVALLAARGLLPRSRHFLRATGTVAAIGLPLIGYLMLTKHMGKPQFYYGLFTAVAATFAVIVARLLSGPPRVALTVLEWRPLVYLGRISYALYLVNSPIVNWFGWERLGWNHPVETLAVAGVAVAAAVALHHGVERPFLRLKSRLQVAGKPDADVVAAARPGIATLRAA